MLGSIGAAAPPPNVDLVVIHADQVLAPVNPLLFGQNLGPWMNTTEGYTSDYAAGGVPMGHPPGGRYIVRRGAAAGLCQPA